jgi:peroxiredoxin
MVVPARLDSLAMATPTPKQDEARPIAVLGQIAFVVLAAVLVYSFVAVTREGEMRRRCTVSCVLHPNYMGASKKAPNFTLKDGRGQEVSLSQFKDKVVVMNFWTTTCRPCLEEMPDIADLAKILKDKSDVVVLTVSIDESPAEAAGVLKAILKEEPPFTMLFDPDNKVVKAKYGTTLFPETWIIDKRGVIRARLDGGKEWGNSAVIEYIDQLRAGGYCPIDINDGRVSGEAAKLCQGTDT